MGRRPWTTRLTVEECLALHATSIARAGLFRQPTGSQATYIWRDSLGSGILAASMSLSHHPRGYIVHFRYWVGEREIRVAIPITSTSCYFGGRRHWLRCPGLLPLIGCGRKVARLYLPPDRQQFACRHCWALSYQSVQQHDKRIDFLRKFDPTELAAACLRGSPRLARLARAALSRNADLARRREHLKF